MNEIPDELLYYRLQLRDAVRRDVRRQTTRRSAVPAVGILAAATGAVVLGLTLTAASPASADASARRALAAAAAAGSGTITGTVTHDGSSFTLDTTEWNGDSIAVTPGDNGPIGPNHAIELVDGAAYVEQSDGTWLHYSNESGVGPKVGPQFELAHNDVAGTTADQIISLATGLTQTSQSDGTTLYTGTIPNLDTDPGSAPSDDTIMRILTNLRTGDNAPNDFHTGIQLQMTAGPDGLVQQISLTIQQQDTGSSADDGAYTWTITYSRLGSTPPITPPATSTPTPPVIWSPGTPCTSPCGG